MLDHEKLTVYQSSLGFITWLDPVFEQTPKSLAVRDQLDRASTSIPLNIAEGNGKYTGRDRCRSTDIARGSALECAACLDVLVAKRLLDRALAAEGKMAVEEMVAMLVGLIRASGSGRVHEDREGYGEVAERGGSGEGED